MKLEILLVLAITIVVSHGSYCEDDECEDEDFDGFGTPASKCGCCPWPCCCKCFQIGANKTGPCRQLLDLNFILDASGSIGQGNWIIAKDFVTKVVSYFTAIGTDQRVAMITYSTNATLEWNLKDAQSDSAAALKQAIMGLVLKGYFTNTVEAMEISVNDVFGSSDNDPQKPNVVVLITDGRSNFRVNEVPSVAQQLRNAAEVFAVGVTSKIDMAELVTITGDPNKVFFVDAYADLYSILEPLQKKICPVPDLEEKCFCCCSPEQFFGGGGAYYYSGY